MGFRRRSLGLGLCCKVPFVSLRIFFFLFSFRYAMLDLSFGRSR